MNPAYSVEGRLFYSGTRAEQFARELALRTGQKVAVMEKVEGLPWHVVCRVTAE